MTDPSEIIESSIITSSSIIQLSKTTLFVMFAELLKETLFGEIQLVSPFR
jgi:hypothetical protein